MATGISTRHQWKIVLYISTIWFLVASKQIIYFFFIFHGLPLQKAMDLVMLKEKGHEPSWAVLSRAEPSWAVLSQAELCWAEPGCAEPSRITKNNASCNPEGTSQAIPAKPGRDKRSSLISIGSKGKQRNLFPVHTRAINFMEPKTKFRWDVQDKKTQILLLKYFLLLLVSWCQSHRWADFRNCTMLLCAFIGLCFGAKNSKKKDIW